jgi:hypothetical protein
MNIELLVKIDFYVKTKSTGIPDVFAQKIGISKSMLFRCIKYMKIEMKAPIVYSRINETYFYTEKGKLLIDKWINEEN